MLQTFSGKPPFFGLKLRSEQTSGTCGFGEPCSHIHITGGLLHWSFVWRLRRHEEGLDWPGRNKNQEWEGGVTLRGDAADRLGLPATNLAVWGLL